MAKDSNYGKQYTQSSYHSRNVAEMNSQLGYNDMSNRANNSKEPSSMHGAKRATQVGPVMPASYKR